MLLLPSSLVLAACDYHWSVNPQKSSTEFSTKWSGWQDNCFAESALHNCFYLGDSRATGLHARVLESSQPACDDRLDEAGADEDEVKGRGEVLHRRSCCASLALAGASASASRAGDESEAPFTGLHATIESKNFLLDPEVEGQT